MACNADRRAERFCSCWSIEGMKVISATDEVLGVLDRKELLSTIQKGRTEIDGAATAR